MKKSFISVNLVSMFSRIDVPEEHKTEFMKEIISTNIKNEKMLSLILIIVDLVLLCIDAAET